MPGLGMVIGTRSEPLDQQFPALYLLDGSEWTLLAGGDDGALGILGINAIFPLDRGFLFGGVRGFLGYYRVGLGACPQDARTNHHAMSAVLLSSGHWIVAGRAIDQSGSVTVFRAEEARLPGTHCPTRP